MYDCQKNVNVCSRTLKCTFVWSKNKKQERTKKRMQQTDILIKRPEVIHVTELGSLVREIASLHLNIHISLAVFSFGESRKDNAANRANRSSRSYPCSRGWINSGHCGGFATYFRVRRAADEFKWGMEGISARGIRRGVLKIYSDVSSCFFLFLSSFFSPRSIFILPRVNSCTLQVAWKCSSKWGTPEGSPSRRITKRISKVKEINW